ncbi:hypothetical protein [Chitinimonas naiadis]
MVISVQANSLFLQLPVMRPPVVGDTGKQTPAADKTGAVTTDAKGTVHVDLKQVVQTAAQRSETFNRFVRQPGIQGDLALSSLADHLDQLQNSIAEDRPDIDPNAWDFTMQNGRLTVISTRLSAQDKDWLESRLNMDQQLVESARTYNQAAISYYQATDENPNLRSSKTEDEKGRRDPATGQFVEDEPTTAFADAKEQISGGAIPFKALLRVAAARTEQGLEGIGGMLLSREDGEQESSMRTADGNPPRFLRGMAIGSAIVFLVRDHIDTYA